MCKVQAHCVQAGWGHPAVIEVKPSELHTVDCIFLDVRYNNTMHNDFKNHLDTRSRAAIGKPIDITSTSGGQDPLNDHGHHDLYDFRVSGATSSSLVSSNVE